MNRDQMFLLSRAITLEARRSGVREILTAVVDEGTGRRYLRIQECFCEVNRQGAVRLLSEEQ